MHEPIHRSVWAFQRTRATISPSNDAGLNSCNWWSNQGTKFHSIKWTQWLPIKRHSFVRIRLAIQFSTNTNDRHPDSNAMSLNRKKKQSQTAKQWKSDNTNRTKTGANERKKTLLKDGRCKIYRRTMIRNRNVSRILYGGNYVWIGINFFVRQIPLKTVSWTLGSILRVDCFEEKQF